MHHLVSLLSKSSQNIDSKRVILHACASLFSCFHIFSYSSKSFQIPQDCMLQIHFNNFSNTVTMHALYVHCFHLFLCTSKSFLIPPECILQRHCFHFLCVNVLTAFNHFDLRHVSSFIEILSLLLGRLSAKVKSTFLFHIENNIRHVSLWLEPWTHIRTHQ